LLRLLRRSRAHNLRLTARTISGREKRGEKTSSRGAAGLLVFYGYDEQQKNISSLERPSRAMGKDKDKQKDKAKSNGELPPLPGPIAALPKGFDLDDPKLLKEIDDAALKSGGYPYDKKLDREPYEQALLNLQIELTRLQAHNLKTRERILILYEGRDGAGKGTCIKAFTEHLNPRNTRSVALGKPTETERGQIYFQRYAVHLPTAGETVLFDRSWYNRAGVERVMGFCSEDELAVFLREAPEFEGLLVRDGIRLFKFFLTVGREMQLKRFHERRHNPLKQWKLSPIDLQALGHWDDYSKAQIEMFRFTHTAIAPWTVIRANDQRRARLETIRTVLSAIEYEGKDKKAVGRADPLIAGNGPEFFNSV
jgi:polyphosphate kinase 2